MSDLSEMRSMALLIFLVYGATIVKPHCLLEDENSAICTAQGYTTIPTKFQHSITILKLSNNHIFALSAKVLRLYKAVIELNLEHNKITSYRNIKAVSVLRKLEIFDLSGNLLQAMDFLIFSKNFYLKELIIDNNPGMYIKEKPVILKSLKSLSLRNNKMFSCPIGALKGFSNLKTLDLRDNYIIVLSTEILKILPKLVNLYLNGNPIAKLEHCVFQVTNLKDRNRLNEMITKRKFDTDVSTDVAIPDYLKTNAHDLSSNELGNGFWYKLIWNISAAVSVSLLLLAVANFIRN